MHSSERTTPQASRRFPVEKLASPPAAAEPSPIFKPGPTNPLTPGPLHVDDMDWTPSYQPIELRPTVSVHQKDQKESLPFYGSLPPAPRPPAWGFLNQGTQKPIQQVIERNPFHHNLPQPPASWQRKKEQQSETKFAPPRFFPASDYAASTGLESMFDRAFTIKSLEDENEQNGHHTPRPRFYWPSADVPSGFFLPSLRLGLLVLSIFAWILSRNSIIAIQVNYVEIFSLGSASLISGFGFLESLKRPQVEWNGVEILLYLTELGAAIYLGKKMPVMHFDGVYFDKYGMLLLAIMAVQEMTGLSALYHNYISTSPSESAPHPPDEQPTNHSSRAEGNSNHTAPTRNVTEKPDSHGFASTSQSSVPPLSFSSLNSGSSSFSPQFSGMRNRFGGLPVQDTTPLNSFSLNNNFDDGDTDISDPLDRDSDTETTATTATTATNNTARNIRYGRNVNDGRYDDFSFFSPGRSELGPEIGGLSLEDQPFRRVTRSQARKKQHNGSELFNGKQWRGRGVY